MVRDYLLVIGVMTGNSLDGADVVLTKFNTDGTIQDLKAHSRPSPSDLTDHLRRVREVINDAKGDMTEAVRRLNESDASFDSVHDKYLAFVARAVNELVDIARADKQLSLNFDLSNIDLIGFHGQTCAHFPPSIARTKDADVVYTCQIGDGQKLADLTGISTVYDFRSDDLMKGGEAAPLAPIHHQHLAEQLRQRGQFPIAFCNAGNTGNFTVISLAAAGGKLAIAGWDVGPFNHYPDHLTKLECGEDCDRDGLYGGKGQISMDLMNCMFNTAVVTQDGRNFLLEQPPKSSDPQWYRLIPEVTGSAPVGGKALSFVDRVRTAEYFSAYIYAFAIAMLPREIEMPSYFALCGGGWKNPVSRTHFEGLVNGDFVANPILPQHQATFTKLVERIAGDAPSGERRKVVVEMSEFFGFDGTAMEARIFADAAACRVKAIPFTKTSTTGVKSDTICGIIRFPGGSLDNATDTLRSWLDTHGSLASTVDKIEAFDGRWSRASAGWNKLLNAVTSTL